MNLQSRTNELFEKYLDGTCSPEEWQELQVLVTGIDESDTDTLSGPLYDLWEKARRRELPSTAHRVDKEKMYAAIVRDGRGRVLSLRIWRSVAAACVILVAVAVWTYSHRAQRPVAALAVAAAQPVINPGIDKAVLTLANGQRVVLDSNSRGVVGQQGSITMTNGNGQLAVQSGGSGRVGGVGGAVAFNQLATGRGNQYEVVLPDGSKVWLNAASSIRFPSSFSGADRTVEMTGEAYFEVAHGAAKPFVVKVGRSAITVLGTSFNVNAYPDEPRIRASLLAGAIQMTAVGHTETLRPGEEASLDSAGQLTKASANVAAAAGWKDGNFVFDKSSIPTVMRQLARWYDIDVIYAGAIPDREFSGSIQRNLPLNAVLHLLKMENINCTISGKTVSVSK